jgi:SSS family solute:Na+ symporter
MEHANTNSLGVEWIGLTMGLGFVLSFGYWCTNVLVVQRAMAADSEESARRVPLIATIPKMFFPFLVILPGLIAVCVGANSNVAANAPPAAVASSVAGTHALPLDESHPHGIIPVKTDPITGAPERDASGQLIYDYNLTIPAMLLHFFPTGILGLGLTALLASFMSGMAGNVTAFNTVWTYDIYQAYIHKNGTDAHYLWMGRMATIGGILLSIGAAYAVTSFNNIMDALQLVFAMINAPLFATFLLGMFWKRTTGHAAFWGLLTGTGAAFIHHGLTLPLGDAIGIHGGWLHVIYQYPSDMAQNFWTAIFAFLINLIVTVAITMVTKPRPESELVGLVYSLTPKPVEGHLEWYQKPSTLAIAVLAVCLVLNLIFA